MTRLFTLSLIIIMLCVCYANIGETSIYILDESKNATCAKEMYHRGDLIVPTFNGQMRSDKPPLHYFFMMAAYSVFGVNSFSARFFSATMGLMLLCAVFLFTRKHLSLTAAFSAVLCGLASLMFMYEFHLAVPDPYLITLLFLANAALYTAYVEKNNLLFLGGYTFLGLALLAKGPIAVVLTGVGWLLYIFFRKINLWNFIKNIRLEWGIPIMLLIAVPWFLAVHNATDGVWTYDFFIGHNFDRFTETREGHGGFFFSSVILTLLVSIPIGLFIPRSVWYALRKSGNDMVVFCASMGIAPMVFFLFSQTILPNYIMPGIPFLLICIASWWTSFSWKKVPVEIYIMAVIALALPFGFGIGMKSEEVFAGLESYGYILWILLIGVILSYIFIRKGNPFRALWMLSMCTAITFIAISGIILPVLDQRNPVTQSREFWEGNEDKFVYYERMNPSFAFYFWEPIPRIISAESIKAGDFVISRSDFAEELKQAGATEVFRYRNIFESRHTVIYTRSEETAGR